MRYEKIELKLMEAELHLDGMNTHAAMKKCLPKEYRAKLQASLNAIRSARDILRNDSHSKQRTITTRGSVIHRYNRHGLWSCNSIPTWRCSICYPATANVKDRKEARTSEMIQDTAAYVKDSSLVLPLFSANAALTD